MADLPSRFGPYEISGPLGAGGMGKVYRARDTRLQRSVAIKILDEAGALDPERHRRFAQEAVAASALNHPNIVTVYDVGVEGDVPYLVSELIEGDALRVELNRGRIPLRRAIEIAHQMAEGLSAAHEAGIVHRDLKPENVMVTHDGRVKIVDFGLAKAEAEDALGASSATQTAAGVILGTVPYMSPEQARGGKADFRSDQFALGVVLFEMLTGAHPFRRDTAVQTLSAIIADDPPDATQLNATLPVSVRWLMRRLLAKTPRERFANTTDLAADLRTIREHLAEATTAAMAAPVTPRRSRRLLLVAALALLAANGVLLLRVVALEQPSVRFAKFTPFATDAGYQGSPEWSPGGKSIAYEAEVNGVLQIFTRTLGSPMRTQVTTSAYDCYTPLWSPDGSQIYYRSLARDQDALWRVSAAGGTPQVVMEGVSRFTISPDGRTLIFLREVSPVSVSMTLLVSSPPGNEPKPYARGALAGQTFSNGVMRFTRDSSKLLAWLWRDADSSGPRTRFWEIPMPDGEPREILSSMTGIRVPPLFDWMVDKRHVVVARADGPTPGTHLWVADTATDTYQPLTATASNESFPTVSSDGTVAFTSEAMDFDLVEVPLDGSPARPFLSSTRNEFDPATSPVSTQYAFITDRTGTLQIWLQNEEGYLQQPLVTDANFGDRPSTALGSLAFSRDGKRLAFQRFDAESEKNFGGPRIWVSAVSGGTPVPLGGGDGYQDAPTWSPDNEWIAFIEGKVGEWSLSKVRVGGGAPPVILKSGIPPYLARPQWSPDGQWIVVETSEGLTLVAADGKTSRVIGDTGWLAYDWGADGRRIYGLRPTDDQHHYMFVSVDAATGAERVINRNLGTIPTANQPIRGFSRFRDRGFLTSVARLRSDIYLIEGVTLPPSFWQRLLPFGTRAR